MKKTVFFVLAFLLMGGLAFADQVEFVSTGQGDKPAGGHYDAPDVGDPYAGKTVTERDDAGHPLTQQSYENCTTDACKRAEQRWSRGGGTTYKDDVKEGLRKPYGPSDEAPANPPAAEPPASE